MQAMSTISSHVRPSRPIGTLPPGIPRLEQGDRLSREEFERRYEAMPGVKAELIEGIVQMASPVRLESHGYPHTLMGTWLGMFHAAAKSCIPADNSTIRLDVDNEPQPDLLLMIDPSRGGQAKISNDGYVEGAPELVVEIASSSVSIDVHSKRVIYRRAGVREYVIWRTLDAQIDWFERAGTEYVRKTPDEKGVLRSTVFPGLWLDAAALLAGDFTTFLATLQQGLATPEHAAFVAQLAAKKPTA